jgi:hypothetical protein
MKNVVLGLAAIWCGSHAFAQTQALDAYETGRGDVRAVDLYGYGPDVQFPASKKRIARDVLRGHYRARYAGRANRIEAEKEKTRYEEVRFDKPDSARQSLLDPASAGRRMGSSAASAVSGASAVMASDPMLTARLGRRVPAGARGAGIGPSGPAGALASRNGVFGSAAAGGALRQRARGFAPQGGGTPSVD